MKYIAHIVDMQRDFYDMLRNLQSQSGGSLMIGSSTFRHFSHTFNSGADTEDINITARVRSLENLLGYGVPLRRQMWVIVPYTAYQIAQVWVALVVTIMFS